MRSFPIRRILVPTDLSPSSLTSLRFARLFAERFSAALTLVYIDPILLATTGIGVELPVYVSDSPEHFARIENEMRDYARDTLRGRSYDIAMVGGQPVPMIVREAQELSADLVVMATHGLRGWRRAILGSVTEGVLHAADAPVLSVSRVEDAPDLPVRLSKILCPINFTEVSRQALDYAAYLAWAFDAELVVVHIAEQSRVAEADLLNWIDPSIRSRCTLRSLLLRGSPADRVIDCAEDLGADLLIVGAQHKRFGEETTIGTTTERLVRFARTPVLSIPRHVEAEVHREIETLAVWPA